MFKTVSDTWLEKFSEALVKLMGLWHAALIIQASKTRLQSNVLYQVHIDDYYCDW